MCLLFSLFFKYSLILLALKYALFITPDSHVGNGVTLGIPHLENNIDHEIFEFDNVPWGFLSMHLQVES